jgi:hypothetical protein
MERMPCTKSPLLLIIWTRQRNILVFRYLVQYRLKRRTAPNSGSRLLSAHFGADRHLVVISEKR